MSAQGSVAELPPITITNSPFLSGDGRMRISEMLPPRENA